MVILRYFVSRYFFLQLEMLSNVVFYFKRYLIETNVCLHILEEPRVFSSDVRKPIPLLGNLPLPGIYNISYK